MNANLATHPENRGGTTTAARSPEPAPPPTGQTWRVVAGTGHRDVKEHTDWAATAIDRVVGRLRDHHGTTTIVTGMARFFDLHFAAAALRHGLGVWAVIPLEAQPDRWPKEDRAEWRRIRDAATKVWVVGEIPADTPPRRRSAAVNALMWKRNAAMVAAGDALVALWDSTRLSGGSYGALILAAKRGMPGVHIDPAARGIALQLPGLDRLEKWSLAHRRCRCVAAVGLRHDVDTTAALFAGAGHAGWTIRRAKPREEFSAFCGVCQVDDATMATLRQKWWPDT